MATQPSKSPHEEAQTPVDLQALLDEANTRIAELEAQLETESIKPIMFPVDDFEAYVAKKLQSGTSLIDLVALVVGHFTLELDTRGFKVGVEAAINASSSNGMERRTGVSHSAAYTLTDPMAIQHIDPRVISWLQASECFNTILGKNTYTGKDELAQRNANTGTGSIFASQLNSLSN